MGGTSPCPRDALTSSARSTSSRKWRGTTASIASPSPSLAHHCSTADRSTDHQTRALRSIMTGAGFSEAVTFGFVAESAAAPFAAADDLVPIANPLSETFAVLRPSILPGLVGAVAHNRRREQRDVQLFEIGARFSRARGERRALACAWTGSSAAITGAEAPARSTTSTCRASSNASARRCAWTADGAAVTSHGSFPGGARRFWLAAPGLALGQLASSIVEQHDVPVSMRSSSPSSTWRACLRSTTTWRSSRCPGTPR